MIAVIGGGVAGATCARELARAGLDVVVLDKGRGTGGRASTRRAPTDVSYDHGAQYFTARTPELRSQVDEWIEREAAAVWNGRIADVRAGTATPKDPDGEPVRYVGRPGMSAIVEDLAVGGDIRRGVTVGAVAGSAGAWTLRDAAGGELGCFDQVVVSAPAPQTAQLLRSAAPRLAERAAGVRMSGCWAVLTAFVEPLELPFDGAFVADSPLSWIARNSSKPGRETPLDTWVLHGSPAWSEAHVEDSSYAVCAALLAAFGEAAGLADMAPREAWAHRWLHALSPQPLPESCLYDPGLRVGVCGDWCGGPRLEGAWLSGRALARSMIEGLSA